MAPPTAFSDPPLLPLKLWYFFFFAAQFTQLFIPLILDRGLHIPPSTAAYIMACRRVVIFLVSPLFTYLCDATHLHRPILALAHILYYLATFALARSRSLPAVFAALLVREAFVSGCEPAINNAAIAKLAQYGVDGFGELRLWGSFGWGFGSIVASFLIDHLFEADYLVALYIQIAFGVVVVVLVVFYIDLSPTLFRDQQALKRYPSTIAPAPTPAPPTPAHQLRAYLSSPRALFTAANVLMQGLIFGVLQMTLFLYFADLGVSTSFFGISVFLACITEGFVFLFTTRIFALSGGPFRTFTLGLLMSSAALLSFSVIHFSQRITLWFLVTTVLNGGTYALFLTAALTIASDMAPPGLQTTAQGSLSALYSGIGPAMGSAVAGLAYRFMDAPTLYCLLAGLQIVMVCISRFVETEPAEKALALPLLHNRRSNGFENSGKRPVRCVSQQNLSSKHEI